MQTAKVVTHSQDVCSDAPCVGRRLTLVAHDDRFLIDAPYGEQRQYVVDRRTMGRQRLPIGSWEVVLDDGWACLVNAGDEDKEVIVLETMLLRQLYKSDTGEQYVIEGKDGKTATWSLTSKMQKIQDVTVKFKTGVLGTWTEVSCSWLVWPRYCGARYLWSCNSLCKSSKWVYNSALSWAQYLAPLVVHAGDHVFPSKCADVGDVEPTDPVVGVLSQPSLTTFSTVALLARWASCSPRAGGLREPANEAAKCLLDGLFRSSCQAKPLVIPVRSDNAWKVS
jgi:hypothetical protein